MGCGVGALGRKKYQVVDASVNSQLKNNIEGNAEVQHRPDVKPPAVDQRRVRAPMWKALELEEDDEIEELQDAKQPFRVEALIEHWSPNGGSAGSLKLSSRKGPPLKFGKDSPLSEIEDSLPDQHVEESFRSDSRSHRPRGLSTNGNGGSLKLAPLNGPAYTSGGSARSGGSGEGSTRSPHRQRRSTGSKRGSVSSLKPPPPSDPPVEPSPPQNLDEPTHELQVESPACSPPVLGKGYTNSLLTKVSLPKGRPPSIFVLDGEVGSRLLGSEMASRGKRHRKGSLGVDLKERLATRERVRQMIEIDEGTVARPCGSGMTQLRRAGSQQSIEELFPQMMQKIEADATAVDVHGLATKKQEMHEQLSATAQEDIGKRRQIFRTLSLKCHANRHNSRHLADTMIEYLKENRDWYLAPTKEPISPKMA
jgi:hypothetical protein